MGLFGPPDIQFLKIWHDYEGLTKALKYKKNNSKIDSWLVRKNAAEALGDLRDEGWPLFPADTVKELTLLLMDEHPEVREAAVITLSKSEAGEALTKALKNTHLDVRKAAIFQLINHKNLLDSNLTWDTYISTGLREVPAVVAVLDESDDEFRKYVGEECVKTIADGGNKILTYALVHGEGNLRQWAAETLGNTRIEFGDRNQALVNALKDRSPDVRSEVVTSLGKVGNRFAIDPLLLMLTDSEEKMRKAAAVALIKIGCREYDTIKDSAIPAITEMGVHRDAVEWLGKLGDTLSMVIFTSALMDSNESAERLTVLLQDSDENMRKETVTTLEMIRMKGTKSPEVQEFQQDRIGGSMAITVKCSKCGNSLMEMPVLAFMATAPDMKQWFGNVCINCKRIYCNNCIKVGGPTPCPNCGQPTEPAQLYNLRKIGVG